MRNNIHLNNKIRIVNISILILKEKKVNDFEFNFHLFLFNKIILFKLVNFFIS